LIEIMRTATPKCQALVSLFGGIQLPTLHYLPIALTQGIQQRLHLWGSYLSPSLPSLLHTINQALSGLGCRATLISPVRTPAYGSFI
jgi:hypothetical protein